jgi:hypothetical protein
MTIGTSFWPVASAIFHSLALAIHFAPSLLRQRRAFVLSLLGLFLPQPKRSLRLCSGDCARHPQH